MYTVAGVNKDKSSIARKSTSGNPVVTHSPDEDFEANKIVLLMEDLKIFTLEVHVIKCQPQNIPIVCFNTREVDIAVVSNKTGDTHTEPC